jgi:hypothetical protein
MWAASRHLLSRGHRLQRRRSRQGAWTCQRLRLTRHEHHLRLHHRRTQLQSLHKTLQCIQLAFQTKTAIPCLLQSRRVSDGLCIQRTSQPSVLQTEKLAFLASSDDRRVKRINALRELLRMFLLVASHALVHGTESFLRAMTPVAHARWARLAPRLLVKAAGRPSAIRRRPLRLRVRVPLRSAVRRPSSGKLTACCSGGHGTGRRSTWCGGRTIPTRTIRGSQRSS